VIFLGRVSASFTHEIKNRLATISESAGFLGDLLDLAEEGRPLDISQLQLCRSTIGKEIKRGFDVVRTFNRFAHSADHPIAKLGVGATVDLVNRVAQFQSFASRVELDLGEGDGPEIETRPLALEGLLYEVLLAAFRGAGADGEVAVAVRAGVKGPVIKFSGGLFGETSVAERDTIKAALEELAAHVFLRDDGASLEIHLPFRIQDVESA
jgi:hypothetical protein